MIRKLTAGLLALLMIIGLAGCNSGDISSGANGSDYPVTVSGTTLNQRPAGVAVLSPSLADVILALQYEVSEEGEIVFKAKSEDCTQAELQTLPNVSISDIDQMKNLGVDTVLLDAAPTEEQAAALKEAGVTAIAVSPATSREDFIRLYREVGSVLRGGNTGYTRGEEVANNVLLTIDDIVRVIPERDIPVVGCYLYDAQGSAAISGTFAAYLLESAGMINGAAEGENGKVEIGVLKLANPSYIFCPVGVREQIMASQDLQDLQAVQSGNVFEMDPSYMTCQGRSVVMAVSTMAGIVYPELLESAVSSPESSSQPESTGSQINSSVSGAPVGEVKKGDTSEDVLRLQNRLDELGYMFVNCTGEFGDGTEQAIRDFQYLNGMEVTGLADAATIEKLFSSDAAPRGNG